jgi:hypothetical protein
MSIHMSWLVAHDFSTVVATGMSRASSQSSWCGRTALARCSFTPRYTSTVMSTALPNSGLPPRMRT